MQNLIKEGIILLVFKFKFSIVIAPRAGTLKALPIYMYTSMYVCINTNF